MDEVGSSIFRNLWTTLGASDQSFLFLGTKKITVSQCEDTTKIVTKKYFVYFI